MEAELEQVDFFLAQSLLDEAMSMLTDLQGRYPGNELIARKMVEVERLQEPPADVASESPFAPQADGDIEFDTQSDNHDDDGFGLRSLDPEPHHDPTHDPARSPSSPAARRPICRRTAISASPTRRWVCWTPPSASSSC